MHCASWPFLRSSQSVTDFSTDGCTVNSQLRVMKSILKAMAPRLVRRAVHRVRRYLESRRNAGRDPEYVFSNIYREGKWGTSLAKKRKEGAPYFSGTGSSSETIVGPYVEDRKSTRLNSSHTVISYAVFCLKKKKKTMNKTQI